MGLDDYEESNASWAALQALEVALRPPPLTAKEIEIRETFAREYMYDQDVYAAAMRCGFGPTFAMDYGRRFLNDPTVQRMLRAMEEAPDPENEDDLQLMRRKKVERALIRDMNQMDFNSGSQSARVSAAGKLMELWGLKAANKVDHNVKHSGNVMVVPGIATMDDWEKGAIDSQAKLVQDANSDATRE